MPYYRRWRIEGGTYFFTLATHRRMRILTSRMAQRPLREALVSVRRLRAFRQIAIVVLPDHLHLLWRLPEGDSDYSTRIGAVKQAFTRSWLSRGGREETNSPSRTRQGYRGVWQKRFYEHTIRDHTDLKRHLDYILHGLVRAYRVAGGKRHRAAGMLDD